MIIYKTTNLINGKIYIGQDSHNNSEYLGSGTLIRRAIKKYGIENFKREILEECQTIEQLNRREIFWIKELNSIDKTMGYNIYPGGRNNIGYKLSEEAIKRRRGKIYVSNLILNKETQISKNKLQEYFDRGWKLGRLPMKESTKKKLAKINLGITLEKRHGKLHANEIKEKLSKNAKGKIKICNMQLGISKFIFEKDLNKYINLGWVKYCKIWICNMSLVQEKHIFNYEFDRYLKLGWKLGRLPMKESTKKKLSELYKGKTFEEIHGNEKAAEIKKKMSESNIEKICIHNNILNRNIKINKEELNSYLNLGWIIVTRRKKCRLYKKKLI